MQPIPTDSHVPFAENCAIVAPNLHADVLLVILSFLNVKDVLQFRQASHFFSSLTKQASLWLALLRRNFPSFPIPQDRSAASLEQQFKFRMNWTSPDPQPVSPPRFLSNTTSKNSHIDGLKIVRSQGVTWAVVVYTDWERQPQPGSQHGGVFITVKAYPLHGHPEGCETTFTAFGKWVSPPPTGLLGGVVAFNENEDSPNILSVFASDGVIYSYSLSSRCGFLPSAQTVLPNEMDRVDLLAIHGNISLVECFPSQELALVELCSSQSNIRFLRNEVGQPLAEPFGSMQHSVYKAAHFGSQYLVLFHSHACANSMIASVYSLDLQHSILLPVSTKWIAATSPVLTPSSSDTSFHMFLNTCDPACVDSVSHSPGPVFYRPYTFTLRERRNDAGENELDVQVHRRRNINYLASSLLVDLGTFSSTWTSSRTSSVWRVLRFGGKAQLHALHLEVEGEAREGGCSDVKESLMCEGGIGDFEMFDVDEVGGWVGFSVGRGYGDGFGDTWGDDGFGVGLTRISGEFWNGGRNSNGVWVVGF
ncbi:hypothetical protein DL96DRAFT_1610119 [Flagelloscypha sp. PMI_526]|nr:hypothetical protein DL96DRAFT_1610119 [Flagelloscypha sp. PMI_526]